jgi:hypothetical protein
MESSIANASYASFILTALFSLPATVRLLKKPWQSRKIGKNGPFEDEDGAATEESMASFSVKGPLRALCGVSALAVAVSFAEAVYATAMGWDDYKGLCLLQFWLLFAAWVSSTIDLLVLGGR